MNKAIQIRRFISKNFQLFTFSSELVPNIKTLDWYLQYFLEGTRVKQVGNGLDKLLLLKHTQNGRLYDLIWKRYTAQGCARPRRSPSERLSTRYNGKLQISGGIIIRF